MGLLARIEAAKAAQPQGRIQAQAVGKQARWVELNVSKTGPIVAAKELTRG